MERFRKICAKIFNVSNFLILIGLVFIVCMLWMKINHNNRQQEYKDRIDAGLQYAKDNMDKEPETNSPESQDRYYGDDMKDIRILNSTPEILMDKKNITSVEAALDKGDISLDKIEGIMIGADIDGKGIERYYFTDKEIIEKVISRLKKMTLTKSASNNIFGYGVEPDWDIQICRSDSKYALRIYGETTNFDNYYRTNVDEVFNIGYYTKKDEGKNAYKDLFGSEYQMLYDENIVDFLYEIIEDNVKNIDIDTVMNVCMKDVPDVATLFKYKHTPPKYTVDMIWGMGRSYIFEFPIEGGDYKLIVLRECFTGNGLPETDVQRLELYNKDGEYIDMLTATDMRVKAFVEEK